MDRTEKIPWTAIGRRTSIYWYGLPTGCDWSGSLFDVVAKWLVGSLNLSFMPELFTPAAMILAQIIIALPLVAGFTMAAVMGVDPDLRTQVLSLGATSRQAAWAVLLEARVGVLVAIIAGFGSIISEVGAVMLVGGNIAGRTRVLTTAIVLDTRRGAFNQALILGGVLLFLAFTANLLMLRLQGRRFDE